MTDTESQRTTHNDGCGRAPAAGWAAWRCPWCGRSNDRQHEGLDTCEHCGSEAKTQYDPSNIERLLVKIAYEPEKQPNVGSQLPAPAKKI